MSIYKKLNKARLQLQSMRLEKSGHNKFAGYKYFELGDFMPSINEIFSNVGLCGVVSYGTDLATLQVFDADSDAVISITSPMADANLKGCHPIQNLGAVETYARRYLWVTLMEIVEHDALDSSEPVPPELVTPHLLAIEKADTMDKLREAYELAIAKCGITDQLVLAKNLRGRQLLPQKRESDNNEVQYDAQSVQEVV